MEIGILFSGMERGKGKKGVHPRREQTTPFSLSILAKNQQKKQAEEGCLDKTKRSSSLSSGLDDSKKADLNEEQDFPSLCADPLLALQWVLRRRARHVGRLLLLRAGAEAEMARAQSSECATSTPAPTDLPASCVVAFLRANEGAVFCGQEEGDKAARRAMLRLEEEGRRRKKRKKKEEEE